MIDPIARSQQAQALLDDPLFKEAFDKVEAAILSELKSPASPRDAELLMAMRLVPKIRGWFIGCVQTGKVDLQIRELEEAKKERK